jgi:glycosyltransferase involved in cell wall biosynthesis
MHIAMLVHNPLGRGTYWRAYYLARELCRRGHRVTLLATAPSERRRFALTYEEEGRLAIVAAPDLLAGGLRAGWDGWATLARMAWLQLAQFDIIHAFECRPAVVLPALAHARTRGLPLVIDWCDWFGRGGSVEERTNPLVRTVLRPLETFFEEHFRNYATATTVINSVLAQKAIALGVDPATITHIPNGCDIHGWPTETASEARALLGLPPAAPLIGYVGVIFPRDAELLAQAFDLVYERQPAARLLVIGYCNIAIEELVRAREAVIRTGPLDTLTLRRYLRACDAGWAPLRDTGANRGRWPLKLSTYMEAGLPFVTSAIGDLGTFLLEHPAGLATLPEPEDLASTTLVLLANPAQRAALSSTGRSLAAHELSWRSVAGRVEEVYYGVVGESVSG